MHLDLLANINNFGLFSGINCRNQLAYRHVLHRQLSLISCFSFYHLEWDPEKEVNDSTIYFTSTHYWDCTERYAVQTLYYCMCIFLQPTMCIRLVIPLIMPETFTPKSNTSVLLFMWCDHNESWHIIYHLSKQPRSYRNINSLWYTCTVRTSTHLLFMWKYSKRA